MLYVASPKRYTILAKKVCGGGDTKKLWEKSNLALSTCRRRAVQCAALDAVLRVNCTPECKVCASGPSCGGGRRQGVDFVTAKRCDCIRTIARNGKGEREGGGTRESHKMCCGLHVNIQIAAQLRCECVYASVRVRVYFVVGIAIVRLLLRPLMNFAEFQLGILSSCLLLNNYSISYLLLANSTNFGVNSELCETFCWKVCNKGLSWVYCLNN